MSNASQLANDAAPRTPRAQASRRFPATVGRFDDPQSRATIDALASWVEERFRDDLVHRPSKHVYLSALPRAATDLVDLLRDSAAIRDAIARHFADDVRIESMPHTDELYLSHYNKDYGGDHGLFAKHYDGNLRFLPVGAVVRALIYVRSSATYKVVFGDSRVEKAFVTYDFGLLDFHRELHWVEGEYRPDDGPRILLKCNYLVTPRDAPLTRRALMGANTAVFYGVKAAMEYSKSPRTLPQRAVGILCNVARLLNNVHPLVPVAVLFALLATVGWAASRLLG